MSSETPVPAQDRPPEPFTRGRIVWSRPPQPVFRVGPLPRAEASPFVAPRQPARGAGVLSGSMIPRARPAVEPVAPARAEAIVEREIAVAPSLSIETMPAATPPGPTSAVVAPAAYASVGAAAPTEAKTRPWLVVAGVAAVVVAGGLLWLATRQPPRPAAPVPTPPAAEAPVVDAAPVIEAPAPDPQRPEPVRTAPVPEEAAPVPAEAAPVVVQPRRPAPAAPAVVAPSAPVQTPPPQPSIDTAPLIVERPTPAAPAPSDPDAPIVTRPQPLD